MEPVLAARQNGDVSAATAGPMFGKSLERATRVLTRLVTELERNSV